MEEKFMKWLVSNQLINIDNAIERSKNKSKLHGKAYDTITKKVCKSIVGEYLNK